MDNIYHKRLEQLRAALTAQGAGGFILPVNDEFMGEYVPSSARRLEWLTGFSGSAGMAALCGDKAAFFTDGRYTLQAGREVPSALYAQFNTEAVSVEHWIGEHAPRGLVMGYDPALHTARQIARLEQEGQRHGVSWKALTPNPVDALWADRPEAPSSMAWIYPERYSGSTPAEKRKLTAGLLQKQGADAFFLTAPDSVCWLLDIRGSDVPHTPFLLCYALLEASGRVTLFMDEARLSADVRMHLGGEVICIPVAEMKAALSILRGKSVLYDPAQSPLYVRMLLEHAGAMIREGEDPCALPKACKNLREIEAVREAHRLDGLAVTRFLYRLSQHSTEMDEQAVNDILLEEREKSDLFIEPSFHTIAGSGPNGAIVHYRSTSVTNRKLDKNTLLLIDSGGQYMGGTTDITRTVAIGKPSDEMKENFTRVLKGHIALARAEFPEGTTGTQLDVLARQHLWEAGLDYDHGTGHGVGACLSVHEGPQRISKRASAVALKPGMILSNEPGYYKTGEYGIRVESLVVVKETREREGRKFLGFDTLTLVPIDVYAIRTDMLTAEEKSWLNAYHKHVYDAHVPFLPDNMCEWLSKACAGI